MERKIGSGPGENLEFFIKKNNGIELRYHSYEWARIYIVAKGESVRLNFIGKFGRMKIRLRSRNPIIRKEDEIFFYFCKDRTSLFGWLIIVSVVFICGVSLILISLTMEMKSLFLKWLI